VVFQASQDCFVNCFNGVVALLIALVDEPLARRYVGSADIGAPGFVLFIPLRHVAVMVCLNPVPYVMKGPEVPARRKVSWLHVLFVKMSNGARIQNFRHIRLTGA
jgi:hypothetical protein